MTPAPAIPDDTARELGEAADVLTRWLDAIDAEELTASATTRYRIEGAVIVLRALAAGAPIEPGAFTA